MGSTPIPSYGRQIALLRSAKNGTFELHTLVFDTGGAPLYDNDFEDED